MLGAGALSPHFPYSPHCYNWSSRTHLLSASITFLFHLGRFVNLPFGISSMTDIVALEIISSNFFDVQNLSSRFIFGCSQTYTERGERKSKREWDCRVMCCVWIRQGDNHRAPRCGRPEGAWGVLPEIQWLQREDSFQMSAPFFTFYTTHNPSSRSNPIAGNVQQISFQGKSSPSHKLLRQYSVSV